MLNLFRSDKTEPEIVVLEKPMYFVGVTMETHGSTFNKDLKKLARKVNMAKLKDEIPCRTNDWAFVTMTKNFDPDEGYVDLVVGEMVTQIGLHLPEEFQGYEVPIGTYAKLTIRPKATFLWNSTIQKAKNYLLKEWLPQSVYEKSDIFEDLEVRDSRSMEAKAELDLYIPLKKKDL